MQLSVPLAPSYMNATSEKREGERERAKGSGKETLSPIPWRKTLEVRGYGDVA